jgi:hypothetical protein
MKKGIVLKAGKHHLTVMGTGGEFYKVHSFNGAKKEGDTIEFLGEQIVHSPRTLKRIAAKHSKSLLTAVAAILLLLFSVPLLNRPNPVFAAVSIDINPSVQLEMDNKYRVIGAAGENADGSNLLASIEWRNRPILEVTDKILSQAQHSGYLSNTSHDILIVPVTIAGSSDPGNIKKLFQTSLPQLAEKLGHNATIIFMEGNKKDRDQAGQEGISIGKHMLYERAKQKNLHISSKEIGQLSISEISSRLGGISGIGGSVQYSGKPVIRPTKVKMKVSEQAKPDAAGKHSVHAVAKPPHPVVPLPASIVPTRTKIQPSAHVSVKPVHNERVHTKPTNVSQQQNDRLHKEPERHDSEKPHSSNKEGEHQRQHENDHQQNDQQQNEHQQYDHEQNGHGRHD